MAAREVQAGADQARRRSDPGWWQGEIDRALQTPDPALRNLRITLCHCELSSALGEVTGARAGANFHTWAVWGSKKAGRTIRREDAPWLPAAAAITGAGLGAALFRGRRPPTLAAAAAGGLAAAAIARAGARRSARMILAGNATVLDDIGRLSARFVVDFHDPEARTPERLQQFLAALPPGPAVDGGKELLRQAFSAYFEAASSEDLDRCHEQMLLANLTALLHEHQRLEPFIDGSLPRPLRRAVTRRMLRFSVGDEQLDVAADVPAPTLPAPETLRVIESEALDRFLHGPQGWDRTPGRLGGSAARDWSKIGDRMNFIVDLFRTRHLDPNLFADPYPPEICEAIRAGRVPAGRL